MHQPGGITGVLLCPEENPSSQRNSVPGYNVTGISVRQMLSMGVKRKSEIRVGSYIVCGLHVGHSAADETRRLVVGTPWSEWVWNLVPVRNLACQTRADKLETLYKSFHGAGESTTAKTVRCRKPGGVATLWNTKYDPLVKVVRLNVDWAVGLESDYNKDFKSSYQCEDEFLNK